MKAKTETHNVSGTDKMIVLSITKIEKAYRITGRVRQISGEAVSAYHTCSRTTTDKACVNGKKAEVVNALTAKIKEREKAASRKQNTAQSGEQKTSHTGMLIAQAFYDVKKLSLESINKNWGANTAKSALIYFERNILPSLMSCEDDPDTIAIAHMLHTKIKDTFHARKGTSADDEGEDNALKLHLTQSDVIYQRMELISEVPLPIIDFYADYGKRNKKEQFKAFSPETRQKIVAYLNNYATINPTMTKRLVAMFDAGLRTSEACAVNYNEIEDQTTSLGHRYGIYQVIAQEDGQNRGHTTKILKTENAYRTVIFTDWALQIIKRCNAQSPENPTDSLPVTQANVCAAFTKMMKEIDCTHNELLQYWNEAEQAIPTQDGPQNVKLTDYVMRRDRASRWKNICGMPSADIDMLLGHRIPTDTRNTLKNRRKRFSLKENLDRLADLNANYFYESPDVPCIMPDKASSESTLTILPCITQKIVNNTNEAIQCRISLRTIEPGDSIVLTAIAQNMQVNVSNEKLRESQPCIGSRIGGEVFDHSK